MYCKETAKLNRFLNGSRLYKVEGFKYYVKKYGWTFLGCHASISVMNFGSMYYLVTKGVNMELYYELITEYMGFHWMIPADVGNFAVALACHKLTTVPRAALSAFLATKIHDLRENKVEEKL